MTRLFSPEHQRRETAEEDESPAAAKHRAWLTSIGHIAVMLLVVACAFGYVLSVRSNHQLDEATHRAANPIFGGFHVWRRVREFTGGGERDLSDFTIEDSPWSISYIAQPRGDDPMRFQVLIYNSHGGFVEVAADLDQPSRGIAHVTGAGDYHLRVNGTALWKISVEEYE